jgi:hypothetical protein
MYELIIKGKGKPVSRLASSKEVATKRAKELRALGLSVRIISPKKRK